MSFMVKYGVLSLLLKNYSDLLVRQVFEDRILKNFYQTGLFFVSDLPNIYGIQKY